MDNVKPVNAPFGFRDVIQAVRRRKSGIIVLFILSMAGALLFQLSRSPEYHAVSVIMINDDSAMEDVGTRVMGTQVDKVVGGVSKDAELLHSLPISEMAVRALWYSPQRASLELFDKRAPETAIGKMLAGIGLFRNATAGTSPNAADNAIDDDGIRRYALRLNDRIRVDPVRETNILHVSVASPFRDEAAFLSNTLCDVYRKSDIQRKAASRAQAHRFLSGLLSDQRRMVDEADSALSAFMTENRIYEVSGNSAEILTKLVDADARYNETLAEYRIAKNSRDFLEKRLTQNDRELGDRIAQNVNAQLGSIQDEIRSRESGYIKILKEKSVGDPQVQEAKQQLDLVKARYEQLSRSKIAGQIGYAGRNQKYNFDLISERLQSDRKLNLLNFSAGEYGRLKQYYESQLLRIPGKQQRFIKLQRDKEVVGKTYSFLKEKLDETRILMGSEAGNVAIVGPAFMPFSPEKPNLMDTIVMGLGFGLILSGIYTIAAESLDSKVKDGAYPRSLGFSVFGVIPFVGGVSGSNRAIALPFGLERLFMRTTLMPADASHPVSGLAASDAPQVPLITDDPDSAFAESFRELKTHLMYGSGSLPMKSVAVSGGSGGDGTSVVSANLAMAWALSGFKTLLVDCDFRAAVQHRIFNLRRDQGFSDLLCSPGMEDLERYCQETGLPNLTVLTAGSLLGNRNEMFGSDRIGDLIRMMEARFDKIVFDSPPLFLSDAVHVGRSAGSVLLVSRLDHSIRQALVDAASDTLFRPHIVGVVLIDTPKNRQGRNRARHEEKHAIATVSAG